MTLSTQIFRKGLLGLVLLVLFYLPVQGQKAKVSLGPDKIAQNQAFTITLTLSNGRLESYKGFPNIPGFQKRGTSSSSNTSIMNGQISSSMSITMTYAPTKQGTFTLKPFSMTINGNTTVSSPGKKITVGPPARRQQRRDPFSRFRDFDMMDEFFGESGEEKEFVDIKEDAFLALTTDKDEVFAGEGFTVAVSFYIAETNRAPLRFNENKLNEDVAKIRKKLEMSNAWHENFNIGTINGEPVTVNNKRYIRYKIYQSAFYPLNDEDVELPSVSLEMIKFKLAKNPTFFGQNRKEGFKTFYTKAKKIKVKPLPPHPLKDAVAVGDFHLDEKISHNELKTGESFSYGFNIYGEGNISTVQEPDVPDDGNIDFYTPNITQNIKRRANHVTGSKSFSYYAIPNEPGKYPLKDYFKWIFFNPKTEKYDTLTASETISVIGESKKNESIQHNDLGNFYDDMDLRANTLFSIKPMSDIKLYANIFILVMLVLSVIFVFKK